MSGVPGPGGRLTVPRLRFGVPLAVAVSEMAELARRAEDAGCESVWLPEHLIWPVAFESSYPYADSGRPPVPAALATYDPWVLLAHVAAATRHLRLGTSVYILPLRDPHVTARAVATLDLVSAGRALLGAGVGWMREEFEIAGQAFSSRGTRSEEIVAILRALWSPGPAHFAGRHYRFPPVHFEPKPPQGARLPIHLGGQSEAALRRAARIADGWIGMPQEPEAVRAHVERLRAYRREYGRESEPLEITTGPPASGVPDAEAAMRYRDAGVDCLSIRPWRRGEDFRAGIHRLGELIAAVRG